MPCLSQCPAGKGFREGERERQVWQEQEGPGCPSPTVPGNPSAQARRAGRLLCGGAVVTGGFGREEAPWSVQRKGGQPMPGRWPERKNCPG